jgi:nucleoside-diphosphate-sugar epimerase
MAYGLSKLYVEGLAAALVANARVDDVTILRLYNAYGPGERAGRLVPRVVAALRAASPFMLTGDPGSLSDPLHVDDVVGGLIAAARGGQEGRVTRLDLCGGDARPLLEQIGRIAAALDSEPPAVEIQANPDEMPIRFWSSSEPVRRHLGLAPFLSLTDGVRRYAAEAGWALRGG